jgi:hypothetical protein
VHSSTQLLPGGASLAPGEDVRLMARFMASTLAFYTHTELGITNRRIYGERPQLAAGLVPLGRERSDFPIGNVAGITIRTGLSVSTFVLGLLWSGVGLWLALFAQPLRTELGLILLIAAILLVAASPQLAIEIMNSGGGTIQFPVSVLERSRALEFANAVSRLLAAEPESHQLAQKTQSNAVGALRELESLLSEGLITQAEYDSKRADVLNRV